MCELVQESSTSKNRVAGTALCGARRMHEGQAECCYCNHWIDKIPALQVGDNMVGSLTTEFPFLLPGVATNRQGGGIVP